MNEERRIRLKKAANQVRRGIIEEVYSAQSGHPGGSLSIADVMTYLYQEELRVDVKTPSGRTGTVWCSPRATSVPLYMPP